MSIKPNIYHKFIILYTYRSKNYLNLRNALIVKANIIQHIWHFIQHLLVTDGHSVIKTLAQICRVYNR